MKIHAVLMLKAPRPGFVKTRLAASVGADRAALIYRRLVEHQIRQIPSHWHCSVHFAPHDASQEMWDWLGDLLPSGSTLYPQRDGDLGDRMRQAVLTELVSEAQAVVLLGGDCPDLISPILVDVEASMVDVDVVFVPAKDGGYVLLSVKADHPELFHDIAWSTDRVLTQTLEAAEASGKTVRLLQELSDVDHVEDLASPAKIFDGSSWVRLDSL